MMAHRTRWNNTGFGCSRVLVADTSHTNKSPVAVCSCNGSHPCDLRVESRGLRWKGAPSPALLLQNGICPQRTRSSNIKDIAEELKSAWAHTVLH